MIFNMYVYNKEEKVTRKNHSRFVISKKERERCLFCNNKKKQNEDDRQFLTRIFYC